MESQKILTADDILKTDDLPIESVPVPEWGGSVLVKALSGAEFSTLEGDGTQDRKFWLKLCAASIVSESGETLFTQHQVDVLGKKSSAALNRIFGVVARLNALNKKDQKDAEKN